jgi:FkbM family methyltransferase
VLDNGLNPVPVGQGLGYLAVAPNSLLREVLVLLQELPLERRTSVVDVGANPNVSDAPYLLMMQQGLCDVVGFEPHPRAFADLQAIKGDRETYLPFAVGDGSAKELKVYKSHGFTSVYEPNLSAVKLLALRPWAEIKSRIDFDTVRLDGSDAIGRFDLLKIDIQGGEGDVFAGAAQKLQSTAMIIVELRYFRLYQGEPMLSGIDAQLRALGFQLHKILPPVSRPFNNSQLDRLRAGRVQDQLIDGDAIYLRDLDRISEFDTAMLAHMALLAASVAGSHSLVLLCLDELVSRGLIRAEVPSLYVDALPDHLKRGPRQAPQAGEA